MITKPQRNDFPADIEGNLAYKEALEQYTYNLETEIAKLYGIQGILATFTVIIFLLILVGSIAIIAGHQICLP